MRGSSGAQIPHVHTLDGVGIEVAAEADCLDDVAAGLLHGAQSVGLLCAERLYLASPTLPDEETLLAYYRGALEKMEGGRVIARICSFSGSCIPAYFCVAPQSNPAMGFCAVRLLLSRPEWFYPQLRALLRAGADGRLSILTPMVSNVDEVLRTRALLEEMRAQLAAEGKPSAEVDFGVTLATPSSVAVSDLIAKYADFFCIDLHSLTQYVLTTDQNSLLYTPHEARSKAVLRYVRAAAKNAHESGIWCGVTGAAWDSELPAALLALGVTMLTAPADQLSAMRSAACTTNVAALQDVLLAELDDPNGDGIFSSKF